MHGKMRSVIDFQTILNQYNLLPNCHRDWHGSNYEIDGDQRICSNTLSLWLLCLPPPHVSGDKGYANTSRLTQYLEMWSLKQLPFSTNFLLIHMSILLHIYGKRTTHLEPTVPVSADFLLTYPARLPFTQF